MVNGKGSTVIEIHPKGLVRVVIHCYCNKMRIPDNKFLTLDYFMVSILTQYKCAGCSTPSKFSVCVSDKVDFLQLGRPGASEMTAIECAPSALPNWSLMGFKHMHTTAV